ncbi:hypothetical protein Dimus_007422 [Dionaea muscipula]
MPIEVNQCSCKKNQWPPTSPQKLKRTPSSAVTEKNHPLAISKLAGDEHKRTMPQGRGDSRMSKITNRGRNLGVSTSDLLNRLSIDSPAENIIKMSIETAHLTRGVPLD